ncbi:MAG: 50S ribosomal protein L23 [Flavobacteriia bacterium]|nr:50S ribosomal protein L23 [Flavobacteriia bacterium]
MESILIRPVITEKASAEAEGRNRYTFVVDKKANKVEIKKAVEAAYNVNVESVRTIIKAIIDVRSGESIDIYGNL